MPKIPVLLIHGFFRQKHIFNKMYRHLSELDYEVHRFNLTPNNGTIGLDKLAEQIEQYVTKKFPVNQTFDLIGLSMGGLVSRYYLQKLGGIKRVRNFITISSPHQGTLTAYLLPLIACQQMRPNSDFLQDLNRDIHLLNQVNFFSLWTPYDFIIIPASSSQLNLGKTIKLSVFTHAMMVRSNQTINTISKILNS